MAYEVTRAAGIELDLELIFDFLFAAAREFGESEEAALQLAERRIAEIEAEMEELGKAPHQGTLRPHLGPMVRNVTKGRAIFYFDADEPRRTLRLLAVFFGGQDHEARFLLRLLTETRQAGS